MTILTETRQQPKTTPWLQPGSVAGSTDGASLVTVKGIASRVVLDPRNGTATKTYRQHFLVGLLYWIAFQSSFPYICNRAAIKAAEYRRRVAGLITKFFLGRNVVAPVLEVREGSDGFAFVTEYVEGTKPRDTKHARRFLGQISDAFIEAGLPPWQVSPSNPRSVGNLIETEDGDYKIIDLESNVVTPMVPITGLWGAARDGHLPAFDDIDVPRLRAFVVRRDAELRSALGPADFRELQSAIDQYDYYEAQWHNNEPRIWGRVTRFIARALDFPGHVRALRSRASKGKGMANDFIQRGIADWRQDELLTEAEAAELRQALATPQVASVIGHLGAHMAISVPLRFPFGALTRAGWTISFRLRQEWRLLRGKGGDRSVRETHSVTVAFVALMPIIGKFAYLTSKPLRSHRALIAIPFDRMLRKLPFRVYGRLHLASLMTWLAKSGKPAPESSLRAKLQPKRVIATVRKSLSSLAPHWLIIGGLLVVNGGVLVAAALYSSSTGSPGVFDELGPFTAFRVAETAAAGALGIFAFSRFWRRDNAASDPSAGGTFFWAAAGLGLAWIAVDDLLQIHEFVGNTLLADRVSMLSRAEDLIVLGYGVIAVGLIALFQREIASSRPVATLLALGTALAGFAITFDLFAPQGGFLADLEHPARIMAVGSLFAAFLLKYREMAPALLARAQLRASAVRTSMEMLQRANGTSLTQEHGSTC